MAQLNPARDSEAMPIPRRQWRLNVALVPALLIAALPKCPLCLLAYAGVLGSLGLDPILYRAWLLPTTLAFAAAALAMLWYRAPRRRGYRPLMLGVAAVTIIITGKFIFDLVPLLIVGMVLLLVASVWNSYPKKEQAAHAGCHC
jgi:mercuric ion transport protein